MGTGRQLQKILRWHVAQEGEFIPYSAFITYYYFAQWSNNSQADFQNMINNCLKIQKRDLARFFV